MDTCYNHSRIISLPKDDTSCRALDYLATQKPTASMGRGKFLPVDYFPTEKNESRDFSDRSLILPNTEKELRSRSTARPKVIKAPGENIDLGLQLFGLKLVALKSSHLS